MALFSKLQASFRRPTTDDVVTPIESSTVEPDKRDYTTESAVAFEGDTALQRGVQDVENVTLNWSKASLIAVFIKYVLTPGHSCTLLFS